MGRLHDDAVENCVQSTATFSIISLEMQGISRASPRLIWPRSRQPESKGTRGGENDQAEFVRVGARADVDLYLPRRASAQDVKIAKSDSQIDARDSGVKLFLRQKIADGNTPFNDTNVILFLHGATGPSTCDFDLPYEDYSWADLMVKRGYVVCMGDYRNYGYSTRARDGRAGREKPAAQPPRIARAQYQQGDADRLVLGRHDGRLLHLAPQRKTSRNSSAMHRATIHTNLGPGSGLQNKRKPRRSRTAVEFWKECLATDPTSNTRTPRACAHPMASSSCSRSSETYSSMRSPAF